MSAPTDRGSVPAPKGSSEQGSPGDIALVFADATLRMGTSRNLLFAAWLDAPRIEHMRAFFSAGKAIGRSYPGGTAGGNLILSGTPTFREEVRQAIVDFSQDKGIFPLGYLHLIEIGGFAGAATRAFLSAAILIGRPKNRTKVTGDVSEGMRWMTDTLARGPTPWTYTDVTATHDAMVRLARTEASPR